MKSGNIAEKKLNERSEAAVYIAAELFLKNGIEPVRMTDVAEAAGMGVASLYRYFGTKERLVVRAGILLWRDLHMLFRGVYEAPDFAGKSGMEQISELLGVYRTLFAEHSDFIRFVADFDDYVVRSGVSAQELAEYEASILDIYPRFLGSFRRGVRDGSVRSDVDPKQYYDTVNHALMALSQKLLRGEILLGDSFRDSPEPELLLTIVTDWLRTHPVEPD